METVAAPFQLLVITSEGTFPQETYWVNRLFESGLQTLHLRKPGWTGEQLSHYLEQIEIGYHARIMVHYQPALQEEFRLKGVHYRLPTLPPVKAYYTVSCSVHAWKEFFAAEESVDYAFISPFFSSISKKGYAGNQELHVLPETDKLQKAVALGGVTENNIEALTQSGMGGAALLGAVWLSANPQAAFLRINERVKNA